MIYQIKEKPKEIYYSVTHQLTITDETGKEYEIRKWEDNKGGGYYLWNEETNNWEDFTPDEEMEEFLLYDVDY